MVMFSCRDSPGDNFSSEGSTVTVSSCLGEPVSGLLVKLFSGGEELSQQTLEQMKTTSADQRRRLERVENVCL